MDSDSTTAARPSLRRSPLRSPKEAMTSAPMSEPSPPAADIKPNCSDCPCKILSTMTGMSSEYCMPKVLKKAARMMRVMMPGLRKTCQKLVSVALPGAAEFALVVLSWAWSLTCTSQTATNAATKLTVLRAKQISSPKRAMASPANAGPTMRETWKVAEDSPMALWMSFSSLMSMGTSDCLVGTSKAVTMPSKTERAMTSPIVACPLQTRKVSSRA
ncbi:MAG: hypothetical protein BWY75_03141 [bacterium ADurb.Bin425]|nr:MAG: hypothetical protein BWY75_03141 [bacterium ADurb.Bin425]